MQRRFTLVVSLFFSLVAHAQLPSSSFSYSCLKDTVIECGPRCTTLKTQIPNIKVLSDNYVVNKINPTGCFRPAVLFEDPGTSTNLSVDDIYSPLTLMPFIFHFYGIYYDQMAIGANGIISFDYANSEQFCGWSLSGNLPSNNYDRAVIMFPFQDVDIRQTTSPNRQIKVDFAGQAPHRKWVLTYYKVPLFNCTNLIDNTYQLVLHEGTGVIEIFVKSRQRCTGWNGGKAIIGMQNYERTKGIMAPGRSATDTWGNVDMNEAWRFTPAGGQPLLKKTELYSINGNFITNGDTADAGNGIYNVSFDNVCIDSTSDYVVKSSYYNFLYFLDPNSWPLGDDDSVVYATDTIHVLKNIVTPQTSVVDANCPAGTDNGSITALYPTGTGYTYSIDGSIFFTSNTITNLAPGIYNVTIASPSGCFFTTTDTVELIYQTQPVLTYPLHTYCNTQTIAQQPLVTGAGSGGFFLSLPQGLNINPNNGFIVPQASDTGEYYVTFFLTSPSSCTAPTASTILRIVDNSKFIWTGASSNAWENAANWSCNNLPTSTSNVFIYEGNVVINSNVTVNSLTVAPGASVTVSQGVNLTVLHP